MGSSRLWQIIHGGKKHAAKYVVCLEWISRAIYGPLLKQYNLYK